MRVALGRFCFAAALAGAGALALPDEDNAIWSRANQLDNMAFTATLLMLIVLMLLWRGRRARGAMLRLRAQLGVERGLRAKTELALSDTHAKLCTLAAAHDKVHEGERHRIARDIHDDLGQNLLTLKIDLALLQRSTAGAHPLVQYRLDALLQQTDLTIRSLRCIIDDLRPAALEAGLRHAIERQISEFSRLNGIRCDLRAEPNVFEAANNSHVETMVFRILQESLSNIARHAQASEVRIALRRTAQGIHMLVSDNGVGMPDGRPRRGCGLRGIEDRVRSAGGQLLIDSRPGHGTALSLAIPLARAETASA